MSGEIILWTPYTERLQRIKKNFTTWSLLAEDECGVIINGVRYAEIVYTAEDSYERGEAKSRRGENNNNK
jgi:hypothetical protein